MCVSYRRLNQVTLLFEYPIPRCDDAIDKIRRWAQELLGYFYQVFHRPACMMRDVDGLTRHYDNPLITQHLTVALQFILLIVLPDLLLMTLLYSTHTTLSNASLLLPPLLPSRLHALLPPLLPLTHITLL